MGLNYSFDLFFPDAALLTLLLDVRALLERSYAIDGVRCADHRTLLQIDDRRIHLPCTADSTEGRTVVLERDRRSPWLDLSICFERDAAFDRYPDWRGPMPRIGTIACQIWRGAITSRATFTAVTSRISVLFEESPSVQRAFVSLGRRCDAALVALDREEGRFVILDEPQQREVVVDAEPWIDEAEMSVELDPAALLASIRAARDALE